ncbi:Sortilin-related receptor [Bagarius yarrelli]|uniref:Sortilin-related receptor n=1 Tax=Bagarius yarrelli TaxID=175774 RepID=A0A556V724_BAGYA|nr:Sortilin-related receptor [Bagarius yarrelli]
MAARQTGEMLAVGRCAGYVLLWLFPLSLCSTLRLHPDPTFMLPQDRGFSLVSAFNQPPDRGAEQHSASQHRHRDRRSSTDTALPKVYGRANLNDSHNQMVVHWAGEKSNVIVALARDSVGATDPKSSSVYVSYDYGTTFIHISDKFVLPSEKDASKQVISQFYHSPADNRRYLFADTKNSYLWNTFDFCKSVQGFSIPFKPTDLLLHSKKPNLVLGYDSSHPNKQLWKSDDFGETWVLIQEHVKSYFWGVEPYDSPTTVLVQRHEPQGVSSILSSTDFFQSEENRHIILERVDSFQLRDKYMFATTTRTLLGSHEPQSVQLWVSYNRQPMRAAQFNTRHPINEYYIADASEDQVFVCVNHNNNVTHLYISDTQGLAFSLSLENVLYYSPEGSGSNTLIRYFANEPFADLHRVEGLRGVFVATLINGSLSEDNMRSVITFDKGGTWELLQPPSFDSLGGSIDCQISKGCSLHLAQRWSQLLNIQLRRMPILSKESAPGLIMATGVPCSEGDYKPWSPSDERGNGCLLGRELVFKRRSPHATCFNGEDFDRPVSISNCSCTRQDYECDYGFKLSEDFSLQVCIPDPEFSGSLYAPPVPCPVGTMYRRSKGYRKVPGDSCNGGDVEARLDGEMLPCPIGESNEFILYAVRNSIHRFDLATGTDQPLPLSGLREAVALDFDYERNCLYWADISLDIIQRLCLNGSSGQEVIVRKGLQNVEALTFDPVSRLLYWVDAGSQKIEVSNPDGDLRRTLVNSSVLEHPRALTLMPDESLMFWTDWGDRAAGVYCSWMDGSNVSRIVSDGVRWPNGITADENWLYWTEAYGDRIERSDFTGGQRTVLMEGLPHPYAIAVFKNDLYWDDWSKMGIFKAPKSGSPNSELLVGKLTGVMDLKIFYKGKDRGHNACADQPCTLLCLPQPGHRHSCVCPDGVGTTRLPSGELQCQCPSGYQLWNNTCVKTEHTCLPNQYRCSNGKCISSIWKCDSDNDCGDMSDEQECHSHQCGPAEFTCARGVCIRDVWRCDGDNDCRDWSDEANCTEGDRCNGFLCSNGTCLPASFHCNGVEECPGGADEQHCDPLCTRYMEFVCRNRAQCLFQSLVCDGTKHCSDGSDEDSSYAGCSTHSEFDKKCDAYNFQCSNGMCVSLDWKCDGMDDCGDYSDEANCAASPTEEPGCSRYFQYECKNGRCVPTWWKCDGENDCGDWSDEAQCTDGLSPHTPAPGPVTCAPNRFHCSSGACIVNTWVCDGYADCPDGSEIVFYRKSSLNSFGGMKGLYLVEPVVAVYAFASFMVYPLVEQYVYRRLWQQITNTSYPIQDTLSQCDTNSSNQSSQYKDVQKAASLFSMYSQLFSTIPSLLMTLVLVAYSDKRGRKITIILPLIGSLVYCLCFLAVSIFELNLYLLIVASIVSSFFGGIGTILGGCFSYVADLSEDGNQKMLRMAGLDMMLGLLSGVALISTGYFLHAVGFNWPFFTAAIFHLLNLIYAVFILEESRVIDSMAPADSNTHTLQKLTLGIYNLFAPGNKQRNSLLALLIIIFCSFSFAYFGGLSLVTLFELNEPLCWNEILIGYGSALSTAVFAVSFAGVYVLSRCLSETPIIFIGMLSVFIGLAMMAFVKTTLLMFLVRVPMLLAIMPFPVMRSMMSKVVSKSEQGALFACVTASDNLTTAVANAAFNSVYAATVAWFPGFSFLLAGGLCLIPMTLLGVLRYLGLENWNESERLLPEEEPQETDNTPGA